MLNFNSRYVYLVKVPKLMTAKQVKWLMVALQSQLPCLITCLLKMVATVYTVM